MDTSSVQTTIRRATTMFHTETRYKTWWPLAAAVLTALMASGIHSHPICSTDTGPFAPAGNLSFCTRYEEFGCCTPEDDAALHTKWLSLKDQAGDKKEWKRCRKRLAVILCEQCSPFGGHVYDKTTYTPAAFPGICGRFCKKFWKSCRNFTDALIPAEYEIERETLVDAAATSSKAFCNAVKPSDSFYCIPEFQESDLFNDSNTNSYPKASDNCMCLKPLVKGLTTPASITNAGDGTNRIFITQQVGTMHIFYPDGSEESEPFLDIRDRVYFELSGMDRGIFSVAFHPNFKENGKFYLTYSARPRFLSGMDHRGRLSEFRVSANNPNQANPYSERVLLQLDQPVYYHNLVTLMFGDDGYLYIASGDGGPQGDPNNEAQTKDSYLGKFLRIDVDRTGEGPLRQYGIPPDNPYVGQSGVLPEIWATGWRSPWGCDIDPGHPVTGQNKGRILCADIGNSQKEELNILEKRGNYGWRGKEGSTCFRGASEDECSTVECQTVWILKDADLIGVSSGSKLFAYGIMISGQEQDPDLRDPIVDYRHNTGGRCAIGGAFYTGCRNPAFTRDYFWGDFINGSIFRLVENKETQELENSVVQMCSDEICAAPLQNTHPRHIVAFGKDENGEVYFSAKSQINVGYKTGNDAEIFMLVDPFLEGHLESCKIPPP